MMNCKSLWQANGELGGWRRNLARVLLEGRDWRAAAFDKVDLYEAQIRCGIVAQIMDMMMVYEF